MADIVERLRNAALDKDNFPRMKSETWLPVGLGLEAAEEIERLRQQNAALLASLDKYKEWFPKLIEGGTFPGESDDLRQQNAELVAALEALIELFDDPQTIGKATRIGRARAAIEANKKAAPREAAHTRD